MNYTPQTQINCGPDCNPCGTYELEGCAGGVPYAQLSAIGNGEATTRWINLETGELTDTKPAGFLTGKCAASTDSLAFTDAEPTATVPFAVPKDNYTAFVTTDGTPAGEITAMWKYDLETATWYEVPLSKDILWTDVASAPAASGNPAGPRFEITTDGAKYFVDSEGRAEKLDTKIDVNLTPITYVPTATGNTANRGQIVVDPDGYVWAIDEAGDAVQLTMPNDVTTTSIEPKVYLGGYVDAQANQAVNVCDALLLSDGTYFNAGRLKYEGHPYDIGKWYYLSQTTAGEVTDEYPSTGIVQQLFFVEDADTLLVNIEQAIDPSTPSYANLVYVNAADVNSGTIYSLSNPPTVNDNSLKGDSANLYIGTDGSTWIWSGSAYVTKVFASTTEWNLATTTIDAQGNKTSAIARTGWVFIGANKNPTCVLDLENTAPGTSFMNVVRMIASNQNSPGRTTMFTMGAQQSVGNLADWRFYYAGNASPNNRSDFGFTGNASPNFTMLYGGLNGVGTTAPLSKWDVNGSFGFAIRGSGGSTSQGAQDGTVVITTAGAVYTLMAADASTNRRVIAIKNVSGGTITVTGNIDLAAGTTLTLPAKASRIFQSNGTSWFIIGGYL